MAAGTSTGAVIAAGIALGVSARGLLALYRELATEAFQRLPWWQVVLNRGNHRYRLDFVARLLTEMGAHLPLNSLPLDVMITAKNTRTGRTDFFVRDQDGNAGQWGDLPLRDAVLASVAAPTYFPPHRRDLSRERLRLGRRRRRRRRQSVLPGGRRGLPLQRRALSARRDAHAVLRNRAASPRYRRPAGQHHRLGLLGSR